MNMMEETTQVYGELQEPRRIGNTAQDESGPRCPTYRKIDGFACYSGQDYEVALCCLLFLRATRLTSDFFLASNYVGAGKFEDVVLLYRLQEDDGSKYRAVLLQAKHKESCSTTKPFRLDVYFKSLKELADKWEPPADLEVQEVTPVLYTNDTHGPCDVVDHPVAGHLRDLLHTRGSVQWALDSTEVGLGEGDQLSDPFRRLLVCSGQISNKTADEYLEDEFRKVLKVQSPDVARSLNNEFKRLLKEWWSEKKESRFLHRDSREWNKILAFQFENLTSDILLRDVEFSRAALDDFNPLTKKSWITVRDKHQAKVAMARLFKARSHVLFLDVDSVTDIWEEVEALWGMAAYRTVAVDLSGCSSNSADALLKTLDEAVSSRCERRLVVVAAACGKPASADWLVVDPGATWSALDAATRDELLSTRVLLQGKQVALRDVVVGCEVGDVMSDRVVVELVCRSAQVALGDDLPPALSHYVPRCLQRTTSSMITLESLGNANTLIGHRTLMDSHVIETNNLKVKDSRALKRSRKVQGVTVFYEVISNYPFRKLCTKYGVRGIWGKVGKGGVENGATEFIPLTWTCEDKVVLVEGDPGIGKSSFVTWMCNQVRDRFPGALVLRIDMGKESDFIKDTDFKDNQQNVEAFLRKGFSSPCDYMEGVVLDHSLQESGNVFLFLDAFDEISPDYTEKCCNLLKEIVKNVRFRQMVVTTRRVTRNQVQESLGTWAFSLPPFQEEEQRRFINKFLREHGKLVDEDAISSLSQTCGPILEIPLLCQMAAELLIKDASKNFQSSGSPWSKVLLYQRFFHQIVEQQMKEKLDLKLSNAAVVRFYKDNKARHFKNLQVFAVKKIIPNIDDVKLRVPGEMPDDKAGLVVATGAGLEFQHKTFAEHFAGLWLAENWGDLPGEVVEGVLFQEDQDLVTATFNWRLFEELELHSAVARGDVGGVRDCLSSATVKRKDRGGRTAWHVAAMTDGNHRDVWEVLWSSREDLEEKDRVLQWSAMDYAEVTGHWEIVDFVLAMGGELNYMKLLNNKDVAKNAALNVAINKDLTNLFEYLLRVDKEIIQKSSVASPLHIAAAAGSTGIARALIATRFPLNVKNSHGVTPLHISSEFGHAAIVRLLLDNGVQNVNIKDRNGNTAVLLAAKKGHLDVVRLLLQHGADVKNRHKKCSVPLMEASSGGHLEVVRFLIPYTENVNIRGNTGNTALHVASRDGYLEVVDLLLRNKADINVKNVYGDTPLMQASRKGHLGIAKLLFENGADVNAEDNDGITVLQEASKGGHLDIVRMLIENGAIVNKSDKCGATALMKASSEGDLQVVGMLLGKGANVNVKDNDGFTALHGASREGHLEVVRMLLDKGADIKVQDNYGITALHSASNEGHLEVVRILLENGAEINRKDFEGKTALHQASAGGHLEVVKMLLDNGAEIIRKDFEGITALHQASAGGHLEVVRMLLDKGADIEVQDNYGITALHSASTEGHLEVVRILLENGAEINRKDFEGKTALHQASTKGNLEVERILLENEVEINRKDFEGKTALHQASAGGHLEAVRMLLDKGADIKVQDNYGITALHSASTEGHLEVVRILLENGAEINRKDFEGKTALHQASTKGNLEVESILLENEVEINRKDFKDKTALHQASTKGNLEVVRMLLDKGADIKVQDNYGITALLEASTEGNLELVRMLLDNGAEINRKDFKGKTALHQASAEGHVEVVRMLVENEADVNVRDNDGVTALQIASANGNEEEVSLLVEKGADLNVSDNCANTSLLLALQKGQLKVVEYLLRKGADVNIKNYEGNTALLLASREGHLEVVRHLLRDGAMMDVVDSNGDTALLIASGKGHEEVVQLLLQSGADVNMKNASGDVALLKASGEGHVKVVRVLLDHGVDPNVKHDSGDTALIRAAKKDEVGVAELLLQRGADPTVKNNQGKTALMLATSKRKTSVTGLLDGTGCGIKVKWFWNPP